MAPCFALLALEAYGALLRTKYRGDGGQVPLQEVFERESIA